MALLNDLIDKADSKVFSGDNAFTLNDTYGFPLDLTKEILSERGMQVDEERFRQLMQEQRERARNARKDAGADAWKGRGSAAAGLAETVFTGYTQMQGDGKVLAIIQNGQQVDSAAEGAERSAWCWTPLPSTGRAAARWATPACWRPRASPWTWWTPPSTRACTLHRAVVSEGTLNVGDTLTAKVDEHRRTAIMRNHTAAHLLQAALRKVLGSHVEQAGQLVNERHVRFDFTHFSALTPEELLQVENLVNQEILKAVPVSVQEMGIEEARLSGAMALFGEKYAATWCGWSVWRTASPRSCAAAPTWTTPPRLGLFKILSETPWPLACGAIEGRHRHGRAGFAQCADGHPAGFRPGHEGDQPHGAAPARPADDGPAEGEGQGDRVPQRQRGPEPPGRRVPKRPGGGRREGGLPRCSPHRQ